MKDRKPLLVYLPQATRDAIQCVADQEGTSASAIGRRILVREFPDRVACPPRRRRPKRPSRS